MCPDIVLFEGSKVLPLALVIRKDEYGEMVE
jgi:hypothetical protein